MEKKSAAKQGSRKHIYLVAAGVIVLILLIVSQLPIVLLNSSQIVINNSGSTNTAGWQLVINPDGSGAFVSQPGHPINYGSKEYPAGTFNITGITTIIDQFGGASKIPTGTCAKSVSFGTTTTITYNGSTSGDVSCLTGTSVLSQELRLQIVSIEQKMGVYS
jgi:hypothetical protein